jgi:hypothetical protein
MNSIGGEASQRQEIFSAIHQAGRASGGTSGDPCPHAGGVWVGTTRGFTLLRKFSQPHGAPFVLQSPPRRGARLDRWKQRRNETCLSTSVCLTRRREGRRKRARPGCQVGEDFPRFYRFLPGLVARFECLTVLSIRLFLALSLPCACSTDTFHGC